jgi:hypothetical protein
MCCPFFEPRNKLGEGPMDPAPRLPLGGAWAGTCVKDGFEPPEDQQRQVCNVGYARGRCPSFASDTQADAVRFSAQRGEDGLVRLVWVLEKDHAPLAHGEVGRDSGDGPLASQIRAFLESSGNQPGTRESENGD